MAKKKSKTQKYKRNLKKKLNKNIKSQVEKEKVKITEKKEIIVNDNVSLVDKGKKNLKKDNEITKKDNSNNVYKKDLDKSKKNTEKTFAKTDKNKSDLDKLNSKDKKHKSFDSISSSNDLNRPVKKEKTKLLKNIDTGLKDINSFFIKIFNGIKKKLILKKENKPKEKKLQLNNTNNNANNLKKKNIFWRLLYESKVNNHIIFNALLLITFIILIIGLFRIEVFKVGTILYISGILLFLIIIALSYNKFISGKVFTIILCLGMGFGIYKMQYTYDFIRNLAFNKYEYKTYYVVTFNTPINKSIYTINNKNVGLLKENCVNVERRLNTKLEKVNYLLYDDINSLFDDFYSSKYRAIIVNENQYKYLENNVFNTKPVKILYEFKANAKK